jgi:hypothetical protein
LSQRGWTLGGIAEALGVGQPSVRSWLAAAAQGGPDALRSRREAVTAVGAENRRVELLPPYAPDLNPVEWLWRHLKDVEMANLTCLDSEELHEEFTSRSDVFAGNLDYSPW